MMNELEAILNRRTIRRFKEDPIEKETVKKIIEAGRRAPTACSLQAYTIIWVKNKEKKEEVWRACGGQTFILEVPVLFTICADIRKITRMMKIVEYESSLEKGLGYRTKLYSIIDAALVAENMTIAAEALGLGSAYVGAIANPKIIEALKLPKGVLPICILCIGYPKEDPPLRPRIPIDCTLFIDEYLSLIHI